MGDHFVLLVDRLLTESTLEAAIESRNRLLQAAASAIEDDMKAEKFRKVEFADISTPRKLVECRICQDEDLDSNMETPCSCCGSLKYAHRRCIQRWCNEKGNTICEICHQQFTPGYMAPPPLFQIGRIPMNFRGNWGTLRRDLQGPRLVATVSTDRDLLNPDYNEYPSSTRNSVYCRLVAVIFMVLLVLRHTLPLILSGTKKISFPLFVLLFLRTAGIVLPVYFMLKAITALQRRRYQQEPRNASFTSSDEESEQSTSESQTNVLNVD